MSLAAAQLAANPTALWPLTETSGTAAADATGHGHTGAYQRSAMVGVFNWGSYAAPYFTGTTSDWISVPASTALSSHAGSNGTWSMDCMVLDDGTFGFQNILTVSDFPGGYELSVRRDSTGLLFVEASQAVGSGFAPFVAQIFGPVGAFSRWYHLGVTYDRAAQQMTLFVDGCPAGSVTSMSHTTSFTNKVWRIGGRGDTSAQRWNGSISHLAIYPTALSPGQIQAHAIAAGIRPPCLPVGPTDGWSVGMILAN